MLPFKPMTYGIFGARGVTAAVPASDMWSREFVVPTVHKSTLDNCESASARGYILELMQHVNSNN